MSDFPEFIANKITDGTADPGSYLVILPTQRGATYIKAQLKAKLGQAGWMPRFSTLNQWAQELSGLESADNLELKFIAYQAYSEVLKGKAQSFSEFFSWCDTLIRDFNEIESQLIPRLPFFKELTDYSEIEHFSFLDSPLTEKQENYRSFWRALPDIHQRFNESLLNSGLGYSGLIIKNALENVANPDFTFEGRILIAGFNALSKGEAQLLKQVQDKNAGEIFYDADEYYLNDNVNHAGHFLRQNLKNSLGKPVLTPEPLDKRKLHIEICEAGQRIDQVQIAAGLLSEMTETERKKTVVVLADEQLLIPLLDKLPKNILKPNITMGIGLADSTFSKWLELIYSLASQKIINTETIVFPTSKLEQFFANPFTNLLFQPKKNWIQLSPGYTSVNILETAFAKVEIPWLEVVLQFWLSENAEKAKILEAILELLEKYLNELTKWSIEKLQGLEAISLMRRTLTKISQLHIFEELGVENHLKLMLGAIAGGSINSIGDPIEDLQIMGLLETRPLSFERVIVCGVNEDTLPGSPSLDSFVPFEIRQFHKMPGRREKEAVYAYNFFRLLQHANHVQLIYNSDRSSFSGGEKSRYIQQIEYELNTLNPNLELAHRYLVALPNQDYERKESVEKTSEIEEKIIAHLEHGLSVSSINTFLTDSLEWYYKYVLRISEPDVIEVNPASYGTVVHEVLENLYSPFKNELLSAEILDKMTVDSLPELHRIFKNYFPTSSFDSGVNKIHFETAKSMLTKYFQSEKALLKNGDDVVFLESEKGLNRILPVTVENKTVQVKLKGFIDKIERRNGMLEIIDYKSGRVDSKDINTKDFSVEKLRKLPKTVQLLTYNWLASEAFGETELTARIITMPAPGNRNLAIQYDPAENAEFENFIREVVLAMLDMKEDFAKNPDFEYAAFE